MTDRGMDGLRCEDLRESRQDWWDDAFTATLLAHLPEAPVRLLDIGCGLAHAARMLLPARTDMTYVGIDIDSNRVRAAADGLSTEPYYDRVSLRTADGARLPHDDGSFDSVLMIAALQHMTDPDAVVRESVRVVRRGGRLIAVEPDNVAQHWYFDGRLPEVTAALQALVAASPGRDLGIGVRIPGMAAQAGFVDVASRPYVVGALRKATPDEHAEHLRHLLPIAAATGLAPDNSLVTRFQEAIESWRASVLDDTARFAGMFVPLFVTTASRP